MTASERCASSDGVATAVAPATALALSGVQFHTATSWPTSISRAAMAAPIFPIPATPMRMRRSPSRFRAFLRRAEHKRSSRRGEKAVLLGRAGAECHSATRLLVRGRSHSSVAMQRETSMASAKKGTVGIIGLGIMGGAFAQNLIAAGWRVIGYDVAPDRRRALAKAGAEIADRCRRRRAQGAGHHHQPAEARRARRDGRRHRQSRLVAPRHRRNVDLHARGQDPRRGGCCARPAM